MLDYQWVFVWGFFKQIQVKYGDVPSGKLTVCYGKKKKHHL